MVVLVNLALCWCMVEVFVYLEKLPFGQDTHRHTCAHTYTHTLPPPPHADTVPTAMKHTQQARTVFHARELIIPIGTED